MNVSLTKELEEFVREKVASGLFSSSSEVVREALRLLKKQDRLYQERLSALRADIREGIESGEPIEADAVFESLRRKHVGER
jgi:antitoxin ParD1/3/4